MRGEAGYESLIHAKNNNDGCFFDKISETEPFFIPFEESDKARISPWLSLECGRPRGRGITTCEDVRSQKSGMVMTLDQVKSHIEQYVCSSEMLGLFRSSRFLTQAQVARGPAQHAVWRQGFAHD